MKIRFKNSGPCRILLRAANWIGDAVMMTPALGALRDCFPRARLFVLAKPWVVPVFEANDHVDHILVYDKNRKHRGLTGFFRLIRKLRAHQFDAAILFQNAFEAALIATFSGIPVRIGYPTDGRGLLLSHRSPLPPRHQKVHQIDYYLGILKGVGIPANNRDLHLSIRKRQADKARRILDDHGIHRKEILVGLNPGAAYGPAKQWPLGRFAALGDGLRESHGAKILIFGGPGDYSLGQEICRLMKYQAVNLAGKTELSEAMALIQECALFVTNDSGLMHVASALKVPLLAIFGSTDPEATGPLGRPGSVLRKEIPCSPCFEPDCPLGHLRCMTQITTDEALKAAKKLL